MKCHNNIYPHTPALPVHRPMKFAPEPAKRTRQEAKVAGNGLRERVSTSGIDRETMESALVYVVDDEPRLLDLYTIILEANGYAVRAFSNRIEALAELKGAVRKPDLLIMDYLGHTLAVDEFMKYCLRAHPGLRIVVASGFSQVDARFSGVRPDRYLQKPFTAEEFLREAEAALAV